jgi:hypothetical protein
MGHDAAHEVLAMVVGDDPVEEVALHRTADARRLKGPAGEELLRVVLAQVEHGDGDRLGDHHEERVLEPERVALDILAVDELEELPPELALQRCGGFVLELRPQRCKGCRGAAISDRILP